MAYQDKEELIVENELQKDDNEKLLSQYEREKQARKDTELVRCFSVQVSSIYNLKSHLFNISDRE